MQPVGKLFQFPSSPPVVDPQREKTHARRQQVLALERRELERRDNLRRSEMPLEPEDERILVTRTGFRKTSATQAVEHWANEPGKPFLGLCGFVGRGKTLAAGWYLSAHGGTYLRESDLPRLIQFERERVLNARVLVLDELGRSKKVESTAPALFELVDERKRANRRTILVSNLSRAQLKELYPDSGLWSRLNRLAVFATAHGDDLREV